MVSNNCRYKELNKYGETRSWDVSISINRKCVWARRKIKGYIGDVETTLYTTI